MAKEKNLPMVLVEWEDIVDHSGWNDTSDIFETAICYSLGWLVSKDKNQICITETLSPGDTTEGFGMVKSIPTKCVRLIRKLR